MNAPTPPEPIEPGAALHALRTTCRSAMLATCGDDGAPEASYAPFAEDGTGAFLIFVSRLARHTAHLRRSGRVSLMLIEEESTASHAFARRRATFACRTEPIPLDSAAGREGLGALALRHGAIIATLRELPDFELFRLVPEGGLLVLGFGRAWRLTGPACGVLQPVGPR